MTQTKTVRVGAWNVTYFYEDTGKPKVLFSHGFTASHRTILGIKHLARNFDIVSVDYPDHGATTDATGELPLERTPEEFINFLTDFTKAIGLKPELLICHSLGALGTFGALDNGVAQKAIFFTPYNYNSIKRPDYNEFRHWLLPDNMEDAVSSLEALSYLKNPLYMRSINLFAKRIVAEKDKRKAVFGTFLNRLFSEQFIESTTKPFYQKHREKILLVAADNDQYVLYSGLQDLARDLDIKLHVMEECGHAMFMEYPQKVVDIIESQIDK